MEAAERLKVPSKNQALGFFRQISTVVGQDPRPTRPNRGCFVGHPRDAKILGEREHPFGGASFDPLNVGDMLSMCRAVKVGECSMLNLKMGKGGTDSAGGRNGPEALPAYAISASQS